MSSSLWFQFNKTGRGSECSQAIMLVTDGAVDTYDTIFEKYNWPERKVKKLHIFLLEIFLPWKTTNLILKLTFIHRLNCCKCLFTSVEVFDLWNQKKKFSISFVGKFTCYSLPVFLSRKTVFHLFFSSWHSWKSFPQRYFSHVGLPFMLQACYCVPFAEK